VPAVPKVGLGWHGLARRPAGLERHVICASASITASAAHIFPSLPFCCRLVRRPPFDCLTLTTSPAPTLQLSCLCNDCALVDLHSVIIALFSPSPKHWLAVSPPLSLFCSRPILCKHGEFLVCGSKPQTPTTAPSRLTHRPALSSDCDSRRSPLSTF
jgi:hypothetical protein